MGKALTDPLFVTVVGLVLVQIVLYRSGWHNRPPYRIALICLSVITLAIGGLGTHMVESYLIDRLNRVHPAPPADALADLDLLIVLSGGYVEAPRLEYDQLSSSSTARVIQGVRSFEASGAEYLVMSGRYTPDPDRMVTGMKALAVAKGVPTDQVILEPQARNSAEHPIELQLLGLVDETARIGVVTSSWHLPRAMQAFEKHFPNLVAIPAYDHGIYRWTGLRAILPNASSLDGSRAALHEYIGRLWYRMSSGYGDDGPGYGA